MVSDEKSDMGAEEHGVIVKPEEPKKDTKKLIVMLIVIIGIFLAFYLFLKFMPDSTIEEEYEIYDYRGFKFVKIGDLWYTQLQKDNTMYNLPLHYGPMEAENVTMIVNSAHDLNEDKDMYLTFNPNGSSLSYVALAAGEMSLSLTKVFQANVTAACTINSSVACYSRPIIDCDNTNKTVIYLKGANETLVEVKDNCYTIQGKDMELIRAVDKVLLQWLQIIQ